MVKLPVDAMKTFAKRILYSTPVTHAVRTSTRRGIRILAYHRFQKDRSGLISQCEHIRRNYHPVSMKQIAEKYVTGARLPNGALAITVDDGYRDFMLDAQPVFSMYQIPVTVFLVTDFVDGRRWLWWDCVRYMFEHTSQTSLRFSGSDLKIENHRGNTAHRVAEALKHMPHKDFLAQLSLLQERLKVVPPEHPPAQYRSISWDDVRKLAAAGVEFGAHTKTHPILSKLNGLPQLREEIAGSGRRLEEELAAAPLHFCYPNGTREDYNEQTVSVVKKGGFVTAVTTECGFNYEMTDPFQLLRVEVDPSMPEQVFAQLLAGLRGHRRPERKDLSLVANLLQVGRERPQGTLRNCS
jgi:peptidoglycan/xylan/chitin deacetylase (PgdA/CDA1 family)